MEHSSLPRMRWRTKIVGAYALTFAAVAVLVGSSSIASAFLSSLKASYLPPHWQIILPSSARFEVDAIASILLAFLVCYPIVAYGAIRLVSPPDFSRKTIAALVAGASFVFYGGAVWGLSADHYYIISLVPFFSVPGPAPAISGYDFYIVTMRAILGWALVFISPIFLTFFLELRRTRGLRWHL